MASPATDRLALLIDADNAQAVVTAELLVEVSWRQPYVEIREVPSANGLPSGQLDVRPKPG